MAENAEALASEISDAELERMIRDDYERKHPKPVAIPTIPRDSVTHDTGATDAFLAQQQAIEQERRVTDLERRLHSLDDR